MFNAFTFPFENLLPHVCKICNVNGQLNFVYNSTYIFRLKVLVWTCYSLVINRTIYIQNDARSGGLHNMPDT